MACPGKSVWITKRKPVAKNVSKWLEVGKNQYFDNILVVRVFDEIFD